MRKLSLIDYCELSDGRNCRREVRWLHEVDPVGELDSLHVSKASQSEARVQNLLRVLAVVHGASPKIGVISAAAGSTLIGACISSPRAS